MGVPKGMGLFDDDEEAQEKERPDDKQKNKKGVLTSKQAKVMAEKMGQDSIFRINTKQLTLNMCKKVIERFAASRFSDSVLVRLTIRALLSVVRLTSTGADARPMTFHEIFAFISDASSCPDTIKSLGISVPQLEKVVSNRNNLLRVVDALSRHSDKMIRNFVDNDGTSAFSIDWKQTRNIFKERLTYNCLRCRLGPVGGRIWRQMVDKESQVREGSHYWPDNRVSAVVLTSPTVAREILFKLVEMGYVEMHQSDIIHNAPPSCSSKHTLVFCSTEEQAYGQCIADVYNIAMNLLDRKVFEEKQVADMYIRSISLSEEEEHQLRLREAGEDILEARLLRLSEVLTIMRDF
eukprot:GHVO01040330.1.p1 GENE.GHVO01040330.1~~GHVO01040330.1.p1  ORF type:complete len:350 (+),score=54.28 GHVO01040330.1:74-1123(+)